MELIGAIPRGTDGLEIGVLSGVCAERIWRVAKPRSLVLLDDWMEGKTALPRRWAKRRQRVLDVFAGQIRQGRVSVVRGDITRGAHKKLAGAAFDWIHADAGVTEPIVRAVLDWHWPMLRQGGYLAIRGYTPSNPENYVIRLFQAHQDRDGDMEVIGISNDTACSRTLVVRKVAR